MGIILLPDEYSTDFSDPRIKPVGLVEINWDNPLTRGLIFAAYYEYNESRAILGGPVSNHIEGDVGKQLDGWNQAAAAELNLKLSYPTPKKMSFDAGTVLMDYERQSGAIANGRRLIHTTNSLFNIAAFNSDNTLFWQINGVNELNLTFTNDVFAIGSGRQKIAATWNQSVPTRSLKINAQTLTRTTTWTGGLNTDPEMSILNTTNGGAGSTGLTKYQLQWDRDLSPSEIALVEENIYQLLKSATPQVYFAPSIAIPIIAPEDVTVAVTISSPVLGQHNVLVVDNIGVVSSITSPVFTQQNDLVTDSMSVDTLISEPVLGQNNILAVDSQDVATTISESSLVEHSVLAIDSLNVGAAISNVDFIQQNILAVNDIDVATEISEAGLLQNNILAVNAVLVDTSVSNVSLITAGVLGVDNLLSATVVTQPNLVQQQVLVVDGVAVGTAITQPLLDQAHALLVDSLASGSSITIPALNQHGALLVDDVSVDTLLSLVSVTTGVVACLAGEVVIASLLNGTVTIQAVLSGKVTKIQLLDGSVTVPSVLSGKITTTQILDGSVTIK